MFIVIGVMGLVLVPQVRKGMTEKMADKRSAAGKEARVSREVKLSKKRKARAAKAALSKRV